MICLEIKRIGLASSIVEFKALREDIIAYIHELSGVKDTIFIVIDNASASNTMSKLSSQTQINQNFLNTDMMIFIFGEKIGKYTQMEWDFLLPSKKKTLIVYRHYFKSHTIDTLDINPVYHHIKDIDSASIEDLFEWIRTHI